MESIFEDLDSEASEFLKKNSFEIEHKTDENKKFTSQDYQENEYTTIH